MRDTKQLPDTDELKKIMEYEAKRDVPPEKVGIHYPDFQPFIRLMDHFLIDAEFFREEHSAKEWLDFGYQEKADALIKELLQKISTPRDDCRPFFDAMYDYLSEEDLLKKADCIFVFGGKTPLRIEKAIQLYQDGWSKKLVLSGHGPYTGRTEETEAEKYRDIAIHAGIPEENILLEKESITIPDNVRRSLNLFEEIGFKPSTIISVNSPQPQRRGWCLFKKYLPDSVELVRQDCPTTEKYSRDGWFTNPEGTRIVLNEFIKMKIAVTLNTA